MLADWEIEELARNGMIEPFDEKMLGPCGYDFHIKRDGWYGPEDVQWNDWSLLLPPLAFATFWTKEKWSIPNTIVGQVISGRSLLERKGVQVRPAKMQPGWTGYLLVEVFNSSSKWRPISLDDPVAEASFTRLTEKPTRSYRGQYQNQGEV